MIRINSLKLSLDEAIETLPIKAAKILKIKPSQIKKWHIHKKAIDARKKSDVHFVFSIDTSLSCDEKKVITRANNSRVSLINEKGSSPKHYAKPQKRPIVVGFGPAGMFAALILAKAGLCPLILERGEAVDERKKAVEHFWRSGELRRNSNVQFGEGGAGTFSDGKLTTGIKSPFVAEILKELVDCGAAPEILFDAKPHIGTDVLLEVVQNIRNKIISYGGEILFENTLTGFKYVNNRLNSLIVSTANGEQERECDFCILAIGHSARDTMEMLYENDVQLLPKAFAMGVRIEHLQSFINKAQYGKFAAHPALHAADYKMAIHLPGGQTAYTFCMCPGGVVVAAASENNGVVTNGMSYASRSKANANSALLISVRPEDFPIQNHPLGGMYWQRDLEQSCFNAGGGNYYAPAQLVGDFLADRSSVKAGEIIPSYKPGVTWTNLNNILPEIITENLHLGLKEMDRIIPGFADENAVLTAIESRSSSPIRICRDEKMQSSIPGLFCCGEGAGYAGGIISSAVDGIKCALALIEAAKETHRIFEI